jgi:hypothetical protein
VRQWLPQRRIARSLVVLVFVGVLEVVSPSAQAAVLPAPTITSITAGNGTLTINMSTAGSTANFWTYNVTRRDTSVNCSNPYGDGVNTNTGSLSATIPLTGLTNGCNYLVRVSGNLAGVGNFAEAEGMPTNFGNYLNLQWANDSGSGVTGIARTPFSTGCKFETVTSLNYSIAGTTSPGGTCNTTSFTGYYSGYIKAPFTGVITFTLSNTDDAGVFAIQGNTVVTQGGGGSASGTVSMIQDQVYRLEYWYHNDGGPGASNVTWAYNSGSATSIPISSIANDPSVLSADGGCSLGMAARCAAGSALEIKQATGTNFDGQYWININGTPTLVYCIMNSVEGGGGWMLAMRGKNSASTFNYESALWTNSTLLNSAYPERFNTSDTYRNLDAKYAPFTSLRGGQIMALYPEVNGTGQTGGAWANNSNSYGGQVVYNSVSNSQKYGFAWFETYNSGMVPWTTWDQTSGFGGDSSGFNLLNAPSGSTAGPTGASTCPNSTITLQSLFSTSVRCAFRQVKSAFDVNETPYSAIGNNIFFSQTNIRFFGINYGNSSTGDLSKVRFGFGWNENGDGNEASNDGNAGIGIYDSGATSLAAGTYNGCCSATNNNSANSTNNNNSSVATKGPKTLTAGQTGLSTTDGSSTSLGFELYVRNNSTAAVSGQTTIRVTAGRLASGTIGQAYSQAVTSGPATYRISPLRPGFSVDSSTGTLKVSSGLAAGTYYETVTATDANGASGAIGITINVVADSNETDTALSFNGSSQFEATSQTYTNTGDFTIEAWIKPGDGCTGSGNATALFYVNSLIFCRGGYWWASTNTGSGWTEARIAGVRSLEWVHLALTRTSSLMRAYINNVNVSAMVGTSYAETWTVSALSSSSGVINIGGTGSSGQYFNGVIDEVKVFSAARSGNTIWTNANIQENVSNSTLVAYYDFNEGNGSTIAANRAQSATSLSDLVITGASSPSWVSVLSITTSGPYTVVTIPRSIINSIGGWRAPESVTAITANIVGGGGGGGGGYQGGGGGGGGFIERTVGVVPKTIYSIQVGVGGRGVFYGGNGTLISPNNGETSTAFGFSAAGGGSGAVEAYPASGYMERAPGSGGSGGGGSWANSFNGGSGITGQGFSGGNSKNLQTGNNGCSSNNYVGAGGGGAAGAGSDATCSKGGNGGAGTLSSVTGTYLAAGGGGSHRSANTTAWMGSGGVGGGGNSAYLADTINDTTGGAFSGGINTGSGGGASLSPTGTTAYGGNGGSGLVTFRYITAFKPTFTYPTNAYLNVGMTETFTTNVAQDSATAVLTRTFRWESSTTGSNGTFSLIKQGTGAANAAFSWIPSDTSTSGSNYVYRVIVTDSDTAGLFIQDTSTPVFAVINRTLNLVSKSYISKTIGVTRMETFTVSFGTPTYTYTLSPPNPFFWIDTTTATTPRIRIADTATVGTYLETFTVTDSVSAVINVPMTIVINPPPSFSAASPQVDSGTVLYLDAGNSASYPGTGTTFIDLSGRGLSADMTWSSGTTAVNAAGTTRSTTSALNNITCAAPTYSGDGNGSLYFNGSSSCAYVRNFGNQPTYTYELWIKRNGDPTSNAGVITNPNRVAADQMNWVLLFNSSGQLSAGVYNGSAFTYTAPITVPDLTWTYVAVTYDGNTLTLYVNNNLSASASVTVTWNPAIIDNGILIGRKYNDTPTFKGSLASLRFYSRALTSAELLQNYNATKERFAGVLNENVVAKKYASKFVDTYTVTAGSDTVTATFTTNALSGIKWDTSTTRSLVLTLQDTLTPGTYYDTITATDTYGVSSRLPITFNISPADTLTVYIDTPTALSYTGSKASFTQSLKVVGLVGLESGTAASATVKFKPAGTTCATGGYCRVGDIGPAGGLVFIDTSTARGDGRIWEVAPANWSGSDDLVTAAPYCSNNNLFLGASLLAVGGGETNTNLAKANCLGGAVGKVNSYNLSNNTGYSDWFIPNANEAAELVKVADQAGLVFTRGNWTTGSWGYWTSTEIDTTTMRSIGGPGNGFLIWNVAANVSKFEPNNNLVRPVRAFRPCWAIDTCTALSTTDTPTASGVYQIVPSALTVAKGSTSNYAAINYVPTNLTINQIAPAALNIPWINTTYPDTYTINFSIPAEAGNFTITTTNGTASGCALDYRKIYTTTQGTCSVTISRAATRNFTADTLTATIFFLAWVNSQPTSQVGGGSSIALNGATSYVIDTTTPPSITGLSTLTLSLSASGNFTITGTGFNGTITVKFWRNKTVTTTSGNGTSIVIPISTISSIGATTGRIAVATAAGQDFSVDTLTITP